MTANHYDKMVQTQNPATQTSTSILLARAWGGARPQMRTVQSSDTVAN